MKLALLADAYLSDETTGVNGTQVQLYQLAHAFAARGHDVHYVCATRGPGTDTQTRDGAVTVHYLRDRPGVLAWINGIRDMGRCLRAIAPDAVYQRGRSPLTLLGARWARRSGRPFVWGSNGEDSGEFFKYCGRLLRSKRSWLRKLVLMPDAWLRDICVHRGVCGATCAVAQTVQQRRRIDANFAKDAVVLPSYFDIPEPTDRLPRERMVLWLATLSPGKQPEMFIDLAKALTSIDGWHFVLAGGTSNGPFARSLERRAAGMPKLEFTGAIPFMQTDALFARASLYVNTSRPDADGLPNAFIQAWLQGTPILSLHHDPNGWIAQHGLGFCAAGNANALMDTARRFLLQPDLIEAMRARCASFARQTFADPRVIDTYLELFAGRAAAASAPCPIP